MGYCCLCCTSPCEHFHQVQCNPFFHCCCRCRSQCEQALRLASLRLIDKGHTDITHHVDQFSLNFLQIPQPKWKSSHDRRSITLGRRSSVWLTAIPLLKSPSSLKGRVRRGRAGPHSSSRKNGSARSKKSRELLNTVEFLIYGWILCLYVEAQ